MNYSKINKGYLFVSSVKIEPAKKIIPDKNFEYVPLIKVNKTLIQIYKTLI